MTYNFFQSLRGDGLAPTNISRSLSAQHHVADRCAHQEVLPTQLRLFFNNFSSASRFAQNIKCSFQLNSSISSSACWDGQLYKNSKTSFWHANPSRCCSLQTSVVTSWCRKLQLQVENYISLKIEKPPTEKTSCLQKVFIFVPEINLNTFLNYL